MVQQASRQDKTGVYAWLVVVILFFAAALNILDRTMISTMRLSVLERIPMTEAQFGLLSSVFLWIYGFMNPVAGYLADKFSRVKVILISMFVWSITTWLTGKVTTFGQLLATRAIMGLSEACYLPAALALIMDYHKGSTQSRATGIHQAGMIVGGSLGFLGALMTEHHDWSFAFSIFGVIGVAFTLVVMLVLKEAPKTENLPDKTESQEKSGEKVAFMDALKHLFTNKSFIYLAIFWGIVGIFAQLEAAWLPTFYQEKFNLTQTHSGFLATACLSPAQVAGLLLGGFIADWWSRKNKYSRISIPIIGIVIAAPCAFLGSFIPVLWTAVGFFLMYGMFRMFVDTNLMPIICATVDSRYRATGYGMMNMFTTVLGGLAAFIAGHLRDGGYDIRIIFMAMAATLTVSAVFLVLIKRDVKKKDAAIQQ